MLRRSRRRLATALTTVSAAGLVAGASAALADTKVAVQSADFGTGARGDKVLTVRDDPDLFKDEPMDVVVFQLAPGNVFIVDRAGDVVAGAGCVRSLPNQASCSADGLDGIFFEGTKFGDVLDNDTNFTSRMRGRGSADRLDGGSNNDRLESDEGGDVLIGDQGNDTAVYGSSHPGPIVVTIDNFRNDGAFQEQDNVVSSTENIHGTASGDAIFGTSDPNLPGVRNVLSGGGGNDILEGLDGDDVLNGDNGFDKLTGGQGRDTVSGGADGDRLLTVDGAVDLISCGEGSVEGLAGERDTLTADQLDLDAPENQLRLGECEVIDPPS